MWTNQLQVIKPDEYRQRIHWLIDRVLDAEDNHNARLRWLILTCREIGEPEFPDRGIVDDALLDQISGSLDAVLIGEGHLYSDRQLQVAVRAARARGIPSEAIQNLVAKFTSGPGRILTTIKSEHRGDFLDALRAL